MLEAGLAGHGPSGRNGGFVSTLWDDLPILRERFGDARAVDVVPRVRARRPRDRRVVRGDRGRRLVRAGADDEGRHVRGAARRLGRARRGLRGRRRRGRRCRSLSRGGGAPALRLAALPRRRAAAHGRERAAGTALARAARPGARGRRSPARAHPRAQRSRPTRSRPTPDGSVRAGAAVLAVNSAHRIVPGLPALARRGVEPHGRDRAGAGRDRGARLDRRREHPRLPDAALLLPDDEGRPHRARLGRRQDGLRRPAHEPARGRPAPRPATRATACCASSRSSAAARSRMPGAARSTSPPRTCRSSARAGASTTGSASPATVSARPTSAARSSRGSRSTGATSSPGSRSSSPTAS